VAIVTGATSGLGLATTEKLAKKRARVIMACRDLEKCKEARRKIILESRNKNVVCRECDLSSMESIKSFAARMLKDEKKINLLINNAGVKQTKLKKLTNDGFEAHLGINYLGHFLLTMLLLDKVKESGPSRILNLVDISYKKAHIDFDDLNSSNSYDRIKAYDQSKLAFLAFSNELAENLKGANVIVNAIYPGKVFTELDRREGFSRSYVFYPFRWLATRTANQGSNTIAFVAVAPQVDALTGECFANCVITEQVGEATDSKIRKRLWLTGEKWTRLQEAKLDVAQRVAKALQEEQNSKNNTTQK